MRKVLAALALGIFLGTAAVQVQGAITAGTTPIEPTPAGILAEINRQLGQYFSLSGNAGELQFAASQSWAVNSDVATSVTSLGPQGASTTVVKWLVVVDNTGAVRYIPAF